MTEKEVQEVMERADPLDNALLRHGYKPYMRDYELIVQIIGRPGPEIYSYLFRYCVEARVRTALTSTNYLASLDERLLDYEAGKDLDGFVWGVKWSQLYPGWELLSESDRARDWSRRLALDMHEVTIQSTVHSISLVFSTLVVRRLSAYVDPNIDRLAYTWLE